MFRKRTHISIDTTTTNLKLLKQHPSASITLRLGISSILLLSLALLRLASSRSLKLLLALLQRRHDLLPDVRGDILALGERNDDEA